MKNIAKANEIGLDFVSWKINKKKAVDSGNYSLKRLLISLSIAFLVVAFSAQMLFYFYQSISSADAETSQKISFLSINQAKAAELADFEAEIMENDEYLEMNANEDYVYNVRIKNVGTSEWKKHEVFLETGPYLKSISKLRHSSWTKYYRVAGLENSVMPGEIADITFRMRPIDGVNGTIQEHFQLVQNKLPINGSLFGFFVELKSHDIAEDQEQVNSPVEIEPSKIEGICEEEITEAPKEEIKSESPEDFCSTLTYDERMDYAECNTGQNENDTTNGITEKILIKNEPIMRIGLFNTESAHRITSNDYFDVYAGNSILLSSLRPNYKVAVSFNFSTKKYTVSTSGITKTTSDYLRFVPRNNSSVMTLIDFENRPKWNPYLNYNQYRNIIEFRYNEITQKMWVINELPISFYLKGLAETSNYSPVEYQKVIATAARTYAMYHYNRGIEYGVEGGSTKHGNEYFHLDAIYDQVYKGYGSEQQLSRMSEAVDSTRGVVVTFNGDVVVTPYFSRSDGRTRAWEEVWYGDAKPWLKSVSVPEDNGEELWGHGVGLSARGALIMTRDKGYSFENTLNHFYSNTGLTKIYE